MQSLWRDEEAARYAGDLGLRVYTSRLLGREKSLVLHGGGNTSVKIPQPNRHGEDENILYVKGSGWDLETIEEAGFSPVRLAPMQRLAELETLSDPDMVNELLTNMIRAGAPAPSVETILHACIPHRYVDHTHADALLAVTNTPGGEQYVRDIYGDRVVIIPYVMPGFDLARVVAREFKGKAHAGTQGMVLLKHGVFSFGATAHESYERMIELVSAAEEFLAHRKAWAIGEPATQSDCSATPLELARLRRDISRSAGVPTLLRVRCTAQTRSFARHPQIERLSQQGPATPDHVIRTKRLPLLGRDVAPYVEAYKTYFARHAPSAREPKTMLDPAPRVVLDSAFGLASVGRTAKDTRIVEELYEHTIDVILCADALERYEALPERDIYDMEYWDLEQAKLKKGGKPPVLTGEVVLITGAASGIGKATVDAFLARGAAVAALDIDPAIEAMRDRDDYYGLRCDVTDRAAVDAALEKILRRYGGIDMLVLNAGMFAANRAVHELPDEQWRAVFDLNLDASFALMRACHPYLQCAPAGGRVVVIGSKNVPAPGPGAAAYSASKAALTQLARVAALEWGAEGIRINTLHPNAVFDTGIWTDEMLAERARRYGMSVEQYKTNNVLRTEVTSRDAAELVAELCGPLFAKTTGAQIPVDGGNERVI